MDEASLRSSMNEHTESPTTTMLARNDDAMTRRLRSEASVGISELIYLHRVTSPPPVVASTSGTRTTTVLSSRKDSSATKTTSAGTCYPVEDYTGKGKAIARYASSLSATHGSASEAEAELDATRDNFLAGVGDWTADGLMATPPLQGSARDCKRHPMNRRPKHKKPVLLIHHSSPRYASSDDDRREGRYLPCRRNKPEDVDQVQPLSRARSYVLTILVIAILSTFALSTFAAHHTGKMRMACTKGIIFSATVLMSCLTVLAMVVARRALLEALLAGLLEFLVGFALVVEIHDFM